MCGLVIIQRERGKPKDRKSHGSERHIPSPLAQDERLARDLAGSFHLAPMGTDEGKGIQCGGFHGRLMAFFDHPAALQSVLLRAIPVPRPAFELAEVIQKERQ